MGLYLGVEGLVGDGLAHAPLAPRHGAHGEEGLAGLVASLVGREARGALLARRLVALEGRRVVLLDLGARREGERVLEAHELVGLLTRIAGESLGTNRSNVREGHGRREIWRYELRTHRYGIPRL